VPVASAAVVVLSVPAATVPTSAWGSAAASALRAAAVAFAKADHRVVVSGRKQDAGQALVRELRSLGAEIKPFRPRCACVLTRSARQTQ